MKVPWILGIVERFMGFVVSHYKSHKLTRRNDAAALCPRARPWRHLRCHYRHGEHGFGCVPTLIPSSAPFFGRSVVSGIGFFVCC